jgi:hypothetical protein
VQSYQWSTRELQTLLSKRVSATKDAAKKQFDATRERELSQEDRTGILGQAKNVAEFIKMANQLNMPVSAIASELNKSFGISKSLANTVAEIGIGLQPVISTIDKSLDSVKIKLAEISGLSKFDQLKSLGTEIESVIKAQVQPKFNVKIDFALPPEAIQNAVRTAITTTLPNLIASLFRNNTVNAQKENKAAAPLV